MNSEELQTPPNGGAGCRVKGALQSTTAVWWPWRSVRTVRRGAVLGLECGVGCETPHRESVKFGEEEVSVAVAKCLVLWVARCTENWGPSEVRCAASFCCQVKCFMGSDWRLIADEEGASVSRSRVSCC